MENPQRAEEGSPRADGRLLQLDPPAGGKYWVLRNLADTSTVGGIYVRADLTEKWAIGATFTSTVTAFKMRASTAAATELQFNAAYSGGYLMRGAPYSPLVSSAPNFATQDPVTTGQTLANGLWTMCDSAAPATTAAWVLVVGGNQYWIKPLAFDATKIYRADRGADPYAGDPYAFQIDKLGVSPGAARFYTRQFVC